MDLILAVVVFAQPYLLSSMLRKRVEGRNPWIETLVMAISLVTIFLFFYSL